MIKAIFEAADVPYRRSRFLKPPAETYAVYMDDVETDGPDGMNLIEHHSVTVELYEANPDDEAEAAIEAAMNLLGLRWMKQDRYWLREEQRYQVIYEFDYILKK